MKPMRSLPLFAVLVSTVLSARAAEPVPVTVDASQKGAPISPFIYGQFIEHLGRCIQGGIWAEMLDDRKFFYDAGSPDSPWKPIGDAGAVRMEAKEAFVNGHSPQIAASFSGNGISQSGLGLVKGKDYPGRIWLAAEGAPTVELRLVWGDGEQARQVVRFQNPSKDFGKHEFRFTSQADTETAA
jgi:alpha-L-arabinofuranosidase